MTHWKESIRKFLFSPWYFAIFAVYPPLALLAFNINELRLVDGLRSIVFMLLGAGLLFVLFWRLSKSRQHAALLVTILWLLLFTYGHFYKFFVIQLNFHAGTWIVPAVYLLLAAGAVAWLSRRKTRVRKAAPILNILAVELLIGTGIQAYITAQPRFDSASAENAPIQTLSVPAGEQAPDIYYIIVDSYGRSDLLERSFQIDNREFIQGLEDLGFYVGKCSQSNYNRTEASLAAALNMMYLQDLDDDFQLPNDESAPLWQAVNHSAVRADLENAGYKTVAFATGYPWSEIIDADVFLAPAPSWSLINNFEGLLISTTPLFHLNDSGAINLLAMNGQLGHQRTELIFDSMDDLAQMPGPKFVFIHILPPHPPFIYAPDGAWTDPAAFVDEGGEYSETAYAEGYRNQVAYINTRLLPAMQTLLEESAVEPVIILQGDHGPWMQSGSDWFMILNAYHLPGHNDLLYPTISPVNSFRLVLDTYFEADYPLLEDISYDSPEANIYDFKLVENPCRLP